MREYDELVTEAMAAPFEGWDFSWLAGRTEQVGPSWSYEDRARKLLGAAESVVDVDTGGGELLASLRPLPAHTVATEVWEPNLPVATDRLAPLGVEVRHASAAALPAADAEFDLVLNRHGGLRPAETHRVLRPGGTLLVQAVGGENDLELNEVLGGAPYAHASVGGCAKAVTELEEAGFEIAEALEERPPFVFHDIGAVVYHLRVVSWQIPDFDVQKYDRELRALDARIRSEGGFVARDHRFLIEARTTA